MTTKHTPGEWHIWNEHLELNKETSLNMPLITSEKGEDIAEIFKDNNHWQANAQLIATAPKLLKACEQMIELTTKPFSVSEHAKRFKFTRNAIAKAKGKEK